MKKILFFTLILGWSYSANGQNFNSKLQTYSDQVVADFNQISKSRIKDLDKIADYIFTTWSANKKMQGLFVCTHNSRRSQFAQIWFQTAMNYYGIPNVEGFSGGTEVTAFNRRAVDALERAGFEYKMSDDAENPTYAFLMGKRYPAIQMFSKKYNSARNPSSDFFAVMVCSDADQSCPVVLGADKRFSLPYTDPRYSDNTVSEVSKYDEICQQIACEMFYVASRVKGQIEKIQESKKR